jgi:hypothetical protein
MSSYPKCYQIIKGLAIMIFFGSAVLLLNNCEKEKAAPRSYPRLSAMAVSNITEHGAIFSAELYSLGTETITDHGFVWGITDPTITNANRIILGPCDKQGAFSAEIVTSLRKDIKYTVKPFVQTKDHVVYGSPISFVSLGSDAPVISDFEPHSAGWMDTLNIKGKNFSLFPGENVVSFNNTKCTTLESTDSTLMVLVSTDLADLESVLSVDLAGNVAVFIKDTLRLKVPVIQNFYPKQAWWGDTITITGKYLQNKSFDMSVSAIFGRYPATISEKNSEVIKIVVPPEVTEIENTLKLNIHNQKYSLKQIFTLLPPSISGISPKEGTWGTILTLKGVFNSKTGRNIVSIGGTKAIVLSASRDSIRVYVPENLTEHSNTLILNSTPFTVTASNPFMLLGPYIESIAPLSGISGREILIRGKYFSGYNNTTVKFGSIDASVVAVGNTYIWCIVPTGLNNEPVKITVKTNSQSFTFGQDFIITNPYLTRVSPLTGTFNDLITVEGQYLTSGIFATYLYFKTDASAGVSAEIVSKMPNSLVVRVPCSLDSIPKQLMIQVGSEDFIFSESFILSPPVISFVSAAGIAPGTDITISGSNFNPSISGNKVFLGAYELTVKSSTSSEIVATVPVLIATGNYQISINVGGYKRVYPDVYNIK